MFTGLVETLAPVIRVVDQPPGKRLEVSAPTFRDASPERDVKIGDSISINGCCLTVIAIDGDRLSFEAGEETLRRTNLGDLIPDVSLVNLERSLAVGDRMGGHYVTGHIDGTGSLVEKEDDPPWANLKFSMPKPLAAQVVSKGSIAVDGISLTVVDVDFDRKIGNYFTVALIPHTLQVTTLGTCKVGDRVNLETDLLAKYVARSLANGRYASQQGA